MSRACREAAKALRQHRGAALWRLRVQPSDLARSGPSPARSRSGRGRSRLPPRSLLLEAQADAAALSAGRHRIVVSGDDAAQLAGSEAELASAIANVVNNAVRYTGEGGRIDVTWRLLPDGSGEVSVSDTGIGIEREHLPRVTERFYRVDGSRSRDTGGTGLGLSIVKHVVQRHGGELDIQSEPGKGSTFRLLFPAARVRYIEPAPDPRHAMTADA